MTKKTFDSYIDSLLEDCDLPTDQEIRSETIIEKRNQNGWKEKNEARHNDPEYGKRVGSKISLTYSTPEGKAKQAAKAKPVKEETKEKIRQVRLGTKRNQATRKKLSNSHKGNQNRCKLIQTPQGLFNSKKLAVEHYFSLGQPNAGKWIDRQLKINGEQFYFVDKEGNRLPLEKQTRRKKN